MNAVAHAIQLVCTGMTFGVLIGSAIQRAKRSKIVLPLEGKVVRLEAERDELQLRVAELEAVPCVVESESGNPGWVDAKDAVRMLADLRVQLAAMCGWSELLAEEHGWTRDNAASFWASRDAARKAVTETARPGPAP